MCRINSVALHNHRAGVCAIHRAHNDNARAVDCVADTPHPSFMRDLLHDMFEGEPTDPTAAARRAMRPPLRKRFYRRAGVAEKDGEFRILLDERPIRTPGRRVLSAPSRALADAIAAEWD